MSSLRSASAARQGGDDFQHLVAWNRILHALPEERGLIAVEVEALDVGNVDDVVIRSRTQPDEFTQVRYGVDLKYPIDINYLTKVKGGGTSLLAKFHMAWTQLGGPDQRPALQLITNKLADPSDSLLRNVDGRTSTLAPALRGALPNSPLAQIRSDLANHLSVGESEIIALFDDLRFRLGCHYANEFEHAEFMMLASGLRHDPIGVRAGIDLVRQWVLNGRRKLDTAEVHREIKAAGLLASEPWTTLAIQAIDHDAHAHDADVALDLVEFYEGDEPMNRRHVRPGGYADMHSQIRNAAEHLRADRRTRVMVTGSMRLATWFAAGEALSEVAGHAVLCGRPHQTWASDSRALPNSVEVRTRPVGSGNSLAVALAFAADPTDDVELFIGVAGLDISTIITIGPPEGERITDSGRANGYAAAIKQAVRSALRQYNAQELHLFLATPAGLALLLGHGWNRVAPTTLWEDLGVQGYERAFSISG